MRAARRPLATLLAVALATLFATALAPRSLAVSTLYVGPGGGGGSCASPAYATIDGAIAAAVSGDTIHLCAGTYAQAASSLSGTLRIEGEGIGETIVESDGSDTRAFTIPASASNIITLADMTIRDISAGDVGAGVYVGTGSTLNVARVRFSGLESTQGGAIFGDGATISVSDSQFLDNTAQSDAAIHCQDVCDLSVSGTLFSDNTATVYPASAIFAYDGTALVVNSTFFGNSGSEMQFAVADAVLRHVTLLSRGSESAVLHTLGTGSVTIHESIIAAESGYAAPGATWSGRNLTRNAFEGASLSAGWIEIAGASPALTVVGDTQVFALFEGHPAAGAGDNAECAAAPVDGVDQVGAARPQGDDCDLGAYETAYVAALPITNSTPATPVTALAVALLLLAALVAAEGAARVVGATLRA